MDASRETNNENYKIPTDNRSLKWWNVKIELNNSQNEPDTIYRILSNSKQTTGYLTNRDWWKSYVQGGILFWEFNGDKMEFFLEVDTRVTEMDITTRFRKTLQQGNLLSVREVNHPIITDKLYKVKTFGTFKERLIKELSL